MHYIALDAHKRYTLASVESASGGAPRETRVPHEPGMLKGFLSQFDKGSPVAVETVGNWYWIVDEIEAAGMLPRLVHAKKAKVMMGQINKTDKLDARGLNTLQRTGTLPTVWIAPAEVRDKRDLARTRMALVQQRTRLKNRLHAALDRFAVDVGTVSDMFGKKGRELMNASIKRLPSETRFSTEHTLEVLNEVQNQIDAIESRMEEVIAETPQAELLRTIPGIGFILSVVISSEVGDVSRFSGPERLASYGGVTPRISESGGKTHFGGMRTDSNQYLKWAFVEAANGVALNRN